jgi:hypothetical protein
LVQRIQAVEYAYEVGILEVQRDNLLRQVNNLIDAFPDKEHPAVRVARQEKERIERDIKQRETGQ